MHPVYFKRKNVHGDIIKIGVNPANVVMWEPGVRYGKDQVTVITFVNGSLDAYEDFHTVDHKMTSALKGCA